MADSSQGKLSYGHVIAAACFSIQAVGIGIYVSYGVFFHSLSATFGWSRAAISGASAVAFFTMGLFGVFIGRFNDRFGPRLLMAVMAVFLGAGCMLMSQLAHLWQLYLFYGIVFGIGLSAVDVIALTTIARWFAHKRGMMTGIVKVGTGAGQFTVPLAASLLISTYGWRTAYVVIGAAAMVILFIISRLLWRDPGQSHGSAPRRPAASRAAAEPSPESLTLRSACRTVQLWTLCMVNLSLLFCLMTILVHIVPHARDTGLSAARAAGVLSTIGGVSMIGRFVTGMAIDRVGSRRLMIGCFFLLIAGLLWLQAARSQWMLYLFAAVYGLAHGGFFTAISPIVAEWFGIVAHGAIFGLVAFFGTIGGAVGPILTGHIFDVTGNYRPAFWLITLTAGIGLALISSLKPIRTQKAPA